MGDKSCCINPCDISKRNQRNQAASFSNSNLGRAAVAFKKSFTCISLFCFFLWPSSFLCAIGITRHCLLQQRSVERGKPRQARVFNSLLPWPLVSWIPYLQCIRSSDYRFEYANPSILAVSRYQRLCVHPCEYYRHLRHNLTVD